MVWSTSYLEQRKFVEDLLGKVSQAEKLLTPAMVESNVEPSASALLNAWQIRYPDDSAVAENGRISWYDSSKNKVMNTFRTVGTPQKITPVPTTGWFPIYEKSYVADSIVAGDIASFGQQYKHLFFHGIIRLTTVAATGVVTLRLLNALGVANGIDTTIASAANAVFTGTSALAVSGNIALVAPADTSHPSSFLSVQFMLYDYQSLLNKSGWTIQALTHTSPFGTRQVSFGAVVSKAVTALATGQITNTNLAKGTRLTWWGYKE